MISTLLTKCVALGLAANMCSVVENAAIKYGIPVMLFAAIVRQESNFHPKAINTVKPGVRIPSFGLGQLTIDTAMDNCRLTKEKIFDPKKNADCSARVFAAKLKKYGGDTVLAIAAYNSGTAFFTASGKLRNQGYVDQVLSRLEEFQR